MQGATIAELHKSFGFSTSVFDLLSAGKAFNVIALASLVAKVALLDNLLLQSATQFTTGTATGGMRLNITVPIAQSVPSSWFGRAWCADNDDLSCLSRDPVAGFLQYATPNFSRVMYDYYTSGPTVFLGDYIQNNVTQCKGSCLTGLPGFGVKVECGATYDAEEENVDPAIALANTEQCIGNKICALTMLSSSYAYITSNDATTSDYLKLTTRWAGSVGAGEQINRTDATQCHVRTSARDCSIRPAVVNYTVSITEHAGRATDTNGLTEWWDHDVKLIDMSGNSTFDIMKYGPTYITPNFDVKNSGPVVSASIENGQIWGMNVTQVLHNGDDILPILMATFNSMFGMHAELAYSNKSGYVIDGATAGGNLGMWWPNLASQRVDQQSCVMDVTEPTIWLVTQMNDILFRSSIAYAMQQSAFEDEFADFLIGPSNFTQAVPGLEYHTTIQYTSNFALMIAATVLMFCCVVAVLPSYWGFWELGRKVTLGPMDIASAFRAPDLHTDAAARGVAITDLMKDLGSRRVQYGIIEGTGRLGVAEFDRVQRLPSQTQVPS